MADTVTQAKREAAMLREIANSEARGVDWSTNLNASADFLEGIAHQPDSALVDELRALDDDLIAILGRPNFTCIGIANRLRQLGTEIKTRSEDEQAHVIAFLLRHWIADRENWADNAATALEGSKPQGGE